MKSKRLQRLTRQRRTRRPSIEILEQREMYIVGGMEVAIEQAPFVVSLQENGSHICGGTLIGERHVLTAAHCVTRGLRPNQVVVNRTDLRTNAGEMIAISGVHRHPGYNTRTLENDIAIVHLTRPITQGVTIVPAKHNDLASPGTQASVVGWGDTKENGRPSPTLRRVAVPVVANEQANRPQSYNGQVTSKMLAAGATGRDSCHGDSGGPLFLRNANGQLRQIGIVSWGQGCARPNKPGIYTRVPEYFDWMRRMMNEKPGRSNDYQPVANALLRAVQTMPSEPDRSPTIGPSPGGPGTNPAPVHQRSVALDPFHDPAEEHRSPAASRHQESRDWARAVDAIHNASDLLAQDDQSPLMPRLFDLPLW